MGLVYHACRVQSRRDPGVVRELGRGPATAQRIIDPPSLLWAVPVDGSLPPRRLNPPLMPDHTLFFSSVRVSPDEARIVFRADVETYQVYELWSTDLEGGTSVRLSGPMVPEGDVIHDVRITPDSARVIYLADQRADQLFELFSAAIDGHAPAVRLHPALPADWDAAGDSNFTPDGRFVVFSVRMPAGAVLLAAPADGSGTAWALNWPFPQGGGVFLQGTQSRVAIATGGRHVFFLGEQDTDGVVELYSVPIDGSAPPREWNAPLVAGGDVTTFALRPSPGAVLYRADQDVDEQFELYLSEFPDAPPPHAPSGAPTRTIAQTVPN